MSFRVIAAGAAAVCAALLAYAYYLQYAVGLNPCPLCLVQRGFFYAILAVSVIAAIHNPARIGRMVYGGLLALFAAGGLAVAARQVWLQHLPPERVPACGPDLFFMLENFPLGRLLETLVKGTGECAKVDWTFLGLSIAEWSLGWFALFVLYGLWLAASRKYLAYQEQRRPAFRG